MNEFVIGYYADQGAPQDFGKSKNFNAKPCLLHYMTAFNKNGGPVYIELYDTATGTATGTPRVLQCPTMTAVGWAQLRMKAGIFVRAVDAPSGGTLIGTDDVKFDCGFTDTIV